MADQLAKGDAKLRSFGFSLFEIPSAPINDLKIFAHSLKEHADADQPYVAQIPLRRRANQNTADIIALVRFVEQETGTPHWNSLVILLKAALRDSNFNKDQLRKLVKYHEKTSSRPLK